jgi:pimeloyl-ACP methyl ester carboxylesterase
MTNVTGQTTRRGALLGAAAGAALLTTPAAAQPSPKTFILVHGAWHGGWCWRRVSDILEGKGHKVFAPTMTGLGERSNQLAKGIDHSMHAVDICNVVTWENLSNIVLVGHSYGGTVINGVAERMADKIGSIVFLDAFLPENGERLVEKSTPAFREAIASAIARGEISFKSPPASAFGVTGTDGAWVDGKTTPQPAATFTEAAVYTGARDRIARKTFIRASLHNSPTFDANLAKAKADRSWTTHEMASGHDVMVIQPEKLAELLLVA